MEWIWYGHTHTLTGVQFTFRHLGCATDVTLHVSVMLMQLAEGPAAKQPDVVDKSRKL